MTYSCVLDVSRELVWYVARLLAGERRRLGTRRGTRLLTPFHQARFVLAWFRDDCDVERLGAGFGLSRATAYRYRDEAIRVLSAQAPDLQEALEKAKDEEIAYLILDGKVVECDRVAGTKISKRAGRSTRGTAGRPTTSAATSKRSWTRTACRGGSPMCFPAPSTI